MLVDETNRSLQNYWFNWQTSAGKKTLAIALGYGSLYNHSSEPNAKVVQDSERNLFVFQALRPIAPEEEIFSSTQKIG